MKKEKNYLYLQSCLLLHGQGLAIRVLHERFHKEHILGDGLQCERVHLMDIEFRNFSNNCFIRTLSLKRKSVLEGDC